MSIEIIFGVPLIWVISLPIVAGVAGFMDALAGGGGIITIPVLLLSGLDPLTAIATNKFQAVFGVGAASARFAYSKLINFRNLIPMLLMAMVGAMLGAICVAHVHREHLMQAVPLMLIFIAFYLLTIKNFGVHKRPAKMSKLLFSVTLPLAIGFWDGLIGPGTGSFFALAFTVLLGEALLQATAHAKLLNFTTNLSALIIFAVAGHILWALGGLMAIGACIGSWLGAHVAVKKGVRFIRYLLIIVSVLMSIRLIYQYWLM